jgi:hypothetical protein
VTVTGNAFRTVLAQTGHAARPQAPTGFLNDGTGQVQRLDAAPRAPESGRV